MFDLLAVWPSEKCSPINSNLILNDPTSWGTQPNSAWKNNLIPMLRLLFCNFVGKLFISINHSHFIHYSFLCRKFSNCSVKKQSSISIATIIWNWKMNFAKALPCARRSTWSSFYAFYYFSELISKPSANFVYKLIPSNW